MGKQDGFDVKGESDEQLIQRVRSGGDHAFEVLYGRHIGIAERVAANLVDNHSDAEDVVAEAFAIVYQHLVGGKGPDVFFRAYLLSVVRRTSFAKNRAASKMHAKGDLNSLDTEVLDEDTVLGAFDNGAVSTAFRSLPERWQAVLWYIDIEGLKPAAASDILGLSPNAVSSLALRAREGLRQAYLQNHVGQAVAEECEPFAGMLGAYARDGLRKSSQQKLERHLDGCSKCTAVLVDLNDVQGAMRASVFPVVAGISFTAAAPFLAGQGTTLVGSLAPKSAAVIWKVGAVVASVAVAATGATIALASSQEAPSSKPVANATWNPPQVSNAPTAPTVNGENTAPVEEPAPLPRTPQPKNARPLPSTLTSKPPKTLLEILEPKLEPGPTTSPANQSSPEPSSLPSQLSTPTPSATHTPTPSVTSAPPETTTPSPTPTPTAEPQVTATFEAFPGTTASEADLRITFRVSGAEGGPGEATFTISRGARIIPGKTIEPEGWKCSAFDVDSRSIKCSTTVVVSGDLQFMLGISRPDQSTALDYQISIPGTETLSFSNTF